MEATEELEGLLTSIYGASIDWNGNHPIRDLGPLLRRE
jgi:hypothetical protein